MNVTARPRSGLVLQGGFNTANTGTDCCDVRSAIPEWTVAPPLPTNRGRPTRGATPSTGWVTRFTGLGTYIVPKIEVQVAGTLRSDQGGSLAANWSGAQLRHRRAEPAVCRHRREHHHRQPDRAGHALRRPRQPVRPAVRQDSAVRAHADERRVRHLQRDERGAGADLQPGVRAERRAGCGRRRCCSRGS